ncbi:hypothetical protein BAUCODRAFT_97493 [Baudoinia panamericana UAMH 10762]|uniref:Major facilitator superfamily (MFS) profile domain-containing protein n=1 Tax=Baudoinia panamericana (strain UAMH 10762) TaxID=717646 RepID=M2N1F9_BAUPA|nr:uncharacterized protein BAUCODRAFT_97493 [Baudoinia panamericana UAMH 10762]EMC92470.1 hypothetical protein BAUCODRAFT_97493 [Baudoinia panamericana UAMH 10762]
MANVNEKNANPEAPHDESKDANGAIDLTEGSERDLDLEAWGEEHGYVLDVEVLKEITPNWQNYQTTADGRTVLIPQPTADPRDPLTWSWKKKHLILIVIACTAFLPDYGSAVGAVTLIPQSLIWGIPQDVVNHSQVGNVFMLGAGGVFVVALAAYFGRLPVLFWFTLTAVWTAAGCAGAATFNTFMAFRILNGFFSTVAQGGGVMFIKDLFFVHERARKINLWASFVILSPYFGPLITAFIISTTPWQWAFGVYTIMTGLCLILQILFAEETFFNRKMPASERPQRTPGVGGKIARLIGTEQWRSRKQRSTFAQAVMRPLRTIMKPTVFISTVYYLCTFAWVVGINTTLSIFITAPPYNFGPRSIGFFYFTPVVAAILGELIGRWLHDAIAMALTHRSKEKKLEPEYRLMAISISTPFMLSGLIVLGFALEEGWHYMLAALGWGLYVFGIMITTVAITAYNLDSYPEGSGEIAAWINFARTTGGFIVSYFQVTWANAEGTKQSFGIQAAICFLAYLMVVFMQAFGQRIRERAGPLRFKTD